MEAVQEETDSKETLRPSSLRNLFQKNKLQVNTPTNILTVSTVDLKHTTTHDSNAEHKSGLFLQPLYLKKFF